MAWNDPNDGHDVQMSEGHRHGQVDRGGTRDWQNQQQQQQQQQAPASQQQQQAQYPMYPQSQCCVSDPNQPGCCGGPPPGQQQQGGMCAPNPDGTCGLCSCTPMGPPGQPEPPSMMCCDTLSCAVLTFVLLTLVGFAVCVASTAGDVFAVYPNVSRTTEALNEEMWKHHKNLTYNMRQSAQNGYVRPPSRCHGQAALVGSFGSVCQLDTLDAVAVVMNLSRWVNFRNTLYFLAMMGTFCLAITIYVVHRQINPMMMTMQQQQAGQYPPPSPPIAFYSTPLYPMFKCAWFVSSFFTFFWVVNEMYQYWWFIGVYLDSTTGKLHDFWADFDKMFVPSMAVIFVYLCWPLCNLVLEFALWFVGIIPWYAYRMMCAPQLEFTRFPETRHEDLPNCVRLDMYFTECNQAKRVMCPATFWDMVTGTKKPFFECMEFGQQQGPGMAPPGSAGAMGAPASNGWGRPPPGPPTPPTAAHRSSREVDTHHGGGGGRERDEKRTSVDSGERSAQNTSPPGYSPTRGFGAPPPIPPPLPPAGPSKSLRHSSSSSPANVDRPSSLRASRDNFFQRPTSPANNSEGDGAVRRSTSSRGRGGNGADNSGDDSDGAGRLRESTGKLPKREKSGKRDKKDKVRESMEGETEEERERRHREKKERKKEKEKKSKEKREKSNDD